MNTAGFSTNTPQHFAIDNAVLYVGFTSPASLGTPCGVVKDSLSVTYTPELKYPEWEGAPGKVADIARIVSATVVVEGSLLEITSDNIKMSAAGMTSEDYLVAPEVKTHDKIIPTLSIATAEYKNYAVVGYINKKTEPMILVVKNALATSPFAITWAEKAENAISITLEGHFAKDALSTVPFEIYNPIDAVA
jgi:hypothetical protein